MPHLATTLTATTLTGLLMATSAIPAMTQPATEGNPDVEHHIIDGKPAEKDPGAAVWMRGSRSPMCSASVIGPEHILTAAHCIGGGGRGGNFSVRVNSLDLHSGGQVIKVASIKKQNDVAVAKLESAIENPVIAELAQEDPPVGSTNQIYGWGATSTGGGGMSKVLKTADVKITSTSQRDAHGGPALGSKAIDGNAWKGDSGGPQFFEGKQVGVASTASPQMKSQYYGSVAKNYDFIQGVLTGKIAMDSVADVIAQVDAEAAKPVNLAGGLKAF